MLSRIKNTKFGKKIKNSKTYKNIKKTMNIKYYKIDNKVVKNMQLQQQAYNKLKRKYSYVINEFKGKSFDEYKKSNKVWIFWFQGIDDAPILVKKCIESIEKSLPDREIIIVNEKNIKEYVDFPDFIIKKFKKGIITYTHFSDLLRIELLARYGGLWVDATVFCTSSEIPNYIINAPLFVYKSINLDKQDFIVPIASSWLISSYANNNILMLTRELLYEYWKKEKKLINYFLFHLFFAMSAEKFQDEWDNIPTFNNINPHILQFELLNEYSEERFQQIKEMSCFHKLNRRIENSNPEKYTFYDYIIKEM